MIRFRLPFLLLAFLFSVCVAHAQVSVQLSIPEHFYVAHESIVATVSLTNNSGRDLTFADTDQYQWFAFRIKSSEGRVIAPRDGRPHLNSITVRAGETVKRSVDLNALYEMGEYGIYAVKAEIFESGADKFYATRPANIEVTEGRLLWKKVAGVPDGMPEAGRMHVFSVLAHQRGNDNLIFVRVEDDQDGRVFCTFPIGRILEGAKPEMQLDSANNLYILQLYGQKAYILTKVSPNGKFLGQTNYSAEKTRPEFRKLADGTLQLIGGRKVDRYAEAMAVNPPKLSVRPPGLPTPPPSRD